MKKLLLIIISFVFIFNVIGCSKDSNIEDCCECIDCPECDVCCQCDNPYLKQ